MHKQLLLLGFTLVLLLMQGCSDRRENDNSALNRAVATNKYMLKDLNGTAYTVVKEADSFTLQNSDIPLVMYDVFATWCPPCRAGAPHLSALQKRYAGKLLILGVSIESDITSQELSAYRNEYTADYPLAFGHDAIAFSRILASSIHVGQQFPIPLMVLYKQGRYVTHYVGVVPEEMIESDIKLVLEAK